MSKTKNQMQDLHNILFEQLERLNDIDIEKDGEDILEQEVKRSAAVQKVANSIIQNANLCLKAVEHADEYGYNKKQSLPEMLDGE